MYRDWPVQRSYQFMNTFEYGGCEAVHDSPKDEDDRDRQLGVEVRRVHEQHIVQRVIQTTIRMWQYVKKIEPSSSTHLNGNMGRRGRMRKGEKAMEK